MNLKPRQYLGLEIAEGQRFSVRHKRAADFSSFLTIIEIGYTISYFEKHGRELEDPWSSRQCAVYQNFSSRQTSSIWIFIKLPQQIKNHLRRIHSREEDWPLSGHPMALHLLLLLSCEHNWDLYIRYLGNELSLMVSLVVAKCHQRILYPDYRIC